MVGAGVLGLPYAMSELGWYVSNPNCITPSTFFLKVMLFLYCFNPYILYSLLIIQFLEG